MNSLISEFNSSKDEKIIRDILIKSQIIANFTSIYAGYHDNRMISSIDFIGPEGYLATKRPWYINTSKQNGIYVTKPYLDTGLKIPVISICQNIKQNKELKGVLCGVISFDDIKN